MRQLKNRNKPAQVVELDNRDRAIIALAAIKEANRDKTFVRVEIDKGYKEVEINKYNKQLKKSRA